MVIPFQRCRVFDERRGVVTGVVLLANVCGALYVGGLLWLLSVLHIDDGVAAHMSTLDWWLGGAVRLGWSSGVAIVVGLVSFVVSWTAQRVCGGLPRLAARPVAVVTTGAAFLGGLIGAIQFVATRPFF